MSERVQKSTRKPSIGQILAFHADHGRGLHAMPVTDCSQCLLDRVAEASDEELIELLESKLESKAESA
jgi:hypothetical protein